MLKKSKTRELPRSPDGSWRWGDLWHRRIAFRAIPRVSERHAFCVLQCATADYDTGENREYAVTLVAKDVAGGTNLVMKTVEEYGRPGTSAPTALRPGSYRAVWNAGADLPDGFESSRVTITVEAR